MTQQEIESRLKEIFELNYEYIRLEGGVPFTQEIKDQAWQQILYYYRKLNDIATKVTETEVKLTLPNLKSPDERRYSIEGIVDIVREEDEVWMYDIKTHDADYIRANKDYYSQQLNVYSYIWEKIRGNQLDHTAVISTMLPDGLKDAILKDDEKRKKIAFENWQPVIELERSNEKISATIDDFGKVVDQIENKSFAPPSPGHLETRIEGTTRKFATQVCRNCDARFSCSSFREYARKGQIRGKFNFSKYLEDLAEPMEQEEWTNSNLDLNRINEQPEITD
jgi:hypothetical protein